MMAYQHENFIREALDALVVQTCMAFTLIAIDDGSNDGTYSILKDYEAGPLNGRMTVLTHPGGANRGIYASYRRCLEELDTEFFMPHASDDFLRPDAIEYFLEIMDANLTTDFLYGPCQIVDSNSNFTGELDGTIDLGQGLDAFCTLLWANPVCEPSMFFRAKCAHVIRECNSNILYGDWLHNMVFFTNYKPFRYTKAVVAYRHHANNASTGANDSYYGFNYRNVLAASLTIMPELLDLELEPLVILAGSSITPTPCNWPSMSHLAIRVNSQINLYSYSLLNNLFGYRAYAALPATLAASIIGRVGFFHGFFVSIKYIAHKKSFMSAIELLTTIIFLRLKQEKVKVELSKRLNIRSMCF